MNKRTLLLASSVLLLLLPSCSAKGDPLPPVSGNTIEVNQDSAYSLDTSFLRENTNTLTGTKVDDVKAYFVSNGVHITYSNDSEQSLNSYCFSQTQTLKNREFSMRFYYLYTDESKKDTPFRLVSEWHKGTANSYPDTYYYYTLDFALEDFKTIALKSSYCYDYYDTKKKEMEYLSCPITYSDVSYGDVPEFTSASFTVGSLEDFPAEGTKTSDSEMGASAFECIRVAASFAESVLQAVSKDYHLW